jgi:predicted nucleotidyltransferase
MRNLVDGTRPLRPAPSLDELRAKSPEIQEICARNGASNVRVFGSVARGDQDEESDVDLLVDIEEGRSIYDVVGLVLDLEDLLGCPVNVIEETTLTDDRFSQRVRKDVVAL